MGTFTNIEAIIRAAATLLGYGATKADVGRTLVEEHGVAPETAFLAVCAARCL